VIAVVRTIDTVMICITVVGVLFAAVVNFRAARVVGRGTVLAQVFNITGALACFYVPAYLSRLLPGMDPRDWSSVLLGIGPIVWFGAPWSAFALIALAQHRRAKKL
jgi:hypothetical protein